MLSTRPRTALTARGPGGQHHLRVSRTCGSRSPFDTVTTACAGLTLGIGAYTRNVKIPNNTFKNIQGDAIEFKSPLRPSGGSGWFVVLQSHRRP